MSIYNIDKEKDLFDAINGLIAYDHGSVDSGINDAGLRELVKKRLHALCADGRTEYQLFSKKFNEVIGRYIIRGPRAVAQGYGIEDLRSFLQWLSTGMGLPE